MDQDDLLKWAYEAYLKEIENRKDEDYEVDKVQMEKLVHAYRFFSDLAKRDGGHVEPFDITPRMQNSGITAYFTVFYVTDNEMEEFAEIMKDASALSINAMLNGDTCISFNIPNVFRRKDGK